MTYYTVTLADGRDFTIEADSEDTARLRGKDFGARVVSVEEAETPAEDATPGPAEGPASQTGPETADAPMPPETQPQRGPFGF